MILLMQKDAHEFFYHFRSGGVLPVFTGEAKAVTGYRSAVQTTRAVYAMAMALAAVIALALPGIYFSLRYQFQRETMDMEAHLNAAAVSDFIRKNPKGWQFEEFRLADLLKDQTDHGAEVRRIVGANGSVIAQSNEKMDAPAILNSVQLTDSGTVVGRFEVLRSLRPLLLETAGMGLIGLLLGSCVLMLLRIYPLRSLNRALESLASEKRRAELVLNSIGDGVITTDENGVVLSANPVVGQIFGCAAHDMVGQNVKVMLPLADHPRHDALVALFMQTGDSKRLGIPREVRAQRRDGSLFAMELRLTEFESDGHRHFLASIRDITERRQAREEVARLQVGLEDRVQLRTAQLQAANEELQAFSFSLSHDLRTPLTSIAGFSGLLRRQLGSDQAAERTRHYLDRIADGVTQMSELIDALLKLAQLSQVKLQWSSVDFSAMVETVLIRYQAAEPGRVVELDVQRGVIAECDATLLVQVFEHLLGNAWKFSEQQAQTRIAFTRVVNPQGEAVYVVEDNGAGFDMAYSSKLFGSFQRLHAVDEFAGAGMGLVTVQRIITRHGGRIWAEASPGMGARFCFTLGTAPV
jgi:PAS domain S-box-containing protein